jgi:TP901-1 family phage major tail protein
MPDNETTVTEDSHILLGCDFDSQTAQAMSGKDVIAMVTNKTGNALLAIAGQQGLSFNLSQETTDAGATKDGGNGWALRFHGSKNWDASIDGLYSPDDEAQQLVASAIENDEYVCLKICKRTVNADSSIKYQPLRMGLAIVTSDNFSAGMDDSTTYSMDFSGSGACWMYETATADEREAAAFTVQPETASTSDGTEG